MPTEKKTTAKKATAKKTTAKKTTAKKATAKKAIAKKTTARQEAVTRSHPARPGDLIVIDSPQVGTPAREGEVLEVIEGEMAVSYRVRWLDGHESILTPAGGSLHLA